MTLTLTSEMEEIINEQIATGQFATQDQVVRIALLNLRRQYDELKAGVAEAIAQADRGELAPIDPAAILAEAKAARQRKQKSGS